MFLLNGQINTSYGQVTTRHPMYHKHRLMNACKSGWTPSFTQQTHASGPPTLHPTAKNGDNSQTTHCMKHTAKHAMMRAAGRRGRVPPPSDMIVSTRERYFKARGAFVTADGPPKGMSIGGDVSGQGAENKCSEFSLMYQ